MLRVNVQYAVSRTFPVGVTQLCCHATKKRECAGQYKTICKRIL